MEKYQCTRDLREDADLTQQQVGKAVNVPQRTYAYYESGQRMVPPHVLCALADYYKVSVDYILGRMNRNLFSRSGLLACKPISTAIIIPHQRHRGSLHCFVAKRAAQMRQFAISFVAIIRQNVYNKINCKIIGKAVERRRCKANGPVPFWMAASCTETAKLCVWQGSFYMRMRGGLWITFLSPKLPQSGISPAAACRCSATRAASPALKSLVRSGRSQRTPRSQRTREKQSP